jgi:hypothetical protein
MRYLLFSACLFFVQIISAQKSLPDSTMKEFTRLTCECATLLKVDQSEVDKAIQNLRTCISSTVGVYQNNGWIKQEWLEDTVWVENFDKEMQASLSKTCPVIKILFNKINNPVDVPSPLPSVNEKYFLTKTSMMQKGMEANVNAGTVNMKRWSAKDMGKAKIQMVFDIRFVFKNEKEAVIYFKEKQQEMSEGGELTANSLNSFGVSESKVYGANPALNGAFGDLDIAQYNFVFRIKNVVAKVFVSASKKATYKEAVVFPKEAIGRIKAAK